jgi:carbamoyltransferase
MNILGLNAFHGDAAAALWRDGGFAFAIEEERLNRIRHWAGFPALACEACLGGVDRSAVSHVAIGRDTNANFWRKVAWVAGHPAALPHAVSRYRNRSAVAGLPQQLSGLGLGGARLHFVEHHRSHLASAFFASPFDEAAVVSIDGFGDFSSAMWGVGRGNRIEVRGSVRFPHSLGIFYSAFTRLLGFPGFGDEYKMMGLAAYGSPVFAPAIRKVISVKGDQIRLNLAYFIHHTIGEEMTWEGSPKVLPLHSRTMEQEFGPSRAAGSELEPRHADLAASVQMVFEEICLAFLRHVQRETGMKNLAYAGGVALNCAVNGKLFGQTPFSGLYIPPAANDAGIAMGAALHVAHQVLGQARGEAMGNAYFGSEYTGADIRAVLTNAGVTFHEFESEHELLRETAAQIAQGKVTGWFQGRMEFGPRALGNRSILADPRRPEMKDILNHRIKRRESFRPFCPSIIAEATDKYFEIRYPSPFMVQAYPFLPEVRERVPAVVHEDGTGRLQTVEEEVNPKYWRLLKEFEKITGVPVLINTSFNENEPIVDSPAQALSCFLRTNMDLLVLGRFMVKKQEQATGGSDH